MSDFGMAKLMEERRAKELKAKAETISKILKKVSREQNKLPKAKVVSPNKKEYKRKPKHKGKTP